MKQWILAGCLVAIMAVGCSKTESTPAGISVAEMQSRVLAVRKEALEIERKSDADMKELKEILQEKKRKLAELKYDKTATAAQYADAQASVDKTEGLVAACKAALKDLKDKAKQIESDIVKQQHDSQGKK